jgi:hypothetical protein
MQPLTATLYILFFWILWGYARIGNFIQPLLKTSSGLIKLLAAISVVGSALLVVFIGSASDGARIAMMKFGVLNGVIMACYLLIAIVSIFGDKWLGFVARILKMGREFPRNRRARL